MSYLSSNSNDETSSSHHHHDSRQELLSRSVSPMEVEEPDSDSDSPEKKKAAPTDWILPILDTWFYEIFAIGFSLACFISIIGVLAAFNQEPAPSLSYGLTLNAIISILATASKSSLIFAVGECIGQLKWVWFHSRRRQLDEMQLFDSASRGPFGSLVVIFQHRGQSLVSLGALVTILALAFDPFIQQILTYPIRNTVDAADSSAAEARQVTSVLLYSSLKEPWSIVLSAQWAANAGDIPTPICPTGNCTWPVFESVGMCRKCEDITASTQLKCEPISLNMTAEHFREKQVCAIIPPQGHYGSAPIRYTSTHGEGIPISNKREDRDLRFDVRFPQYSVWSPFGLGFGPDAIFNNYSYAGVANPQTVIAQAEFSLARNYTLRSTPHLDVGKDLKIRKVSQCALSLCLQTYNVSVSNGAVSSNVTSVDYGEMFYVDNADGRIYTDFPENKYHDGDLEGILPCWKPSHRHPVTLTKATITNTTSVWLNASEFAFEIPQIVALGIYTQGNAASRIVVRQDSSTEYPGYEDPDPVILKFVKNGLEETTQRIASSFTRSAMAHSNFTVKGTVFTAKLFVSVNWPLITLPAALIVLSVIFLLSTILTNRRQRLRLWKTSLLAVLFHGLDGWTSVDDRNATVSQMERTAHNLDVELKSPGDGKSLMLEQR